MEQHFALLVLVVFSIWLLAAPFAAFLLARRCMAAAQTARLTASVLGVLAELGCALLLAFNLPIDDAMTGARAADIFLSLALLPVGASFISTMFVIWSIRRKTRNLHELPQAA